MGRLRTVGPRQALLVVERRGPAQCLPQPAVLEAERLEPRLEPTRDEDAGHFGGAPEDGGEGQPHHPDGEPVGDGQAPARLAAAAHVVGEVGPDALAGAVNHVQGLASSAGVRRRQRKDIGAVFHVGHRYAGQRTDDQVVSPELLAQGSQVARDRVPR